MTTDPCLVPFSSFSEIDAFIDKLQSTIDMFASLEAADGDDGEDGFVPFV
jgi:hypothetical protein